MGLADDVIAASERTAGALREFRRAYATWVSKRSTATYDQARNALIDTVNLADLEAVALRRMVDELKRTMDRMMAEHHRRGQPISLSRSAPYQPDPFYSGPWRM